MKAPDILILQEPYVTMYRHMQDSEWIPIYHKNTMKKPSLISSTNQVLKLQLEKLQN